VTATSMIEIALIRTDGGTQTRAELYEATVAEYAEAMDVGERFPPVTIYYDGSAYWLADGFHRIAAAVRLKQDSVECRVLSGTQRDAILHAVGANAEHGLRRTTADKRRAAEILLRDDEWTKRSDSWIADKCHISDKTVAKYRTDFGIPKSDTVSAKDGRSIRTENIGPRTKKKCMFCEGRVPCDEDHSVEIVGAKETFAAWGVSSSDTDEILQLATKGTRPPTLASPAPPARAPEKGGAITPPSDETIAIPVVDLATSNGLSAEEWNRVFFDLGELLDITWKHSMNVSEGAAGIEAGRKLFEAAKQDSFDRVRGVMAALRRAATSPAHASGARAVDMLERVYSARIEVLASVNALGMYMEEHDTKSLNRKQVADQLARINLAVSELEEVDVGAFLNSVRGGTTSMLDSVRGAP
jgi:hypothetical protein